MVDFIDKKAIRNEMKYATLLGYKYSSTTATYFLSMVLNAKKGLSAIHIVSPLVSKNPYHIENEMRIMEKSFFADLNEGESEKLLKQLDVELNERKNLADENRLSYETRYNAMLGVLAEYNLKIAKQRVQVSEKEMEKIDSTNVINETVELYKLKQDLEKGNKVEEIVSTENKQEFTTKKTKNIQITQNNESEDEFSN